MPGGVLVDELVVGGVRGGGIAPIPLGLRCFTRFAPKASRVANPR